MGRVKCNKVPVMPPCVRSPFRSILLLFLRVSFPGTKIQNPPTNHLDSTKKEACNKKAEG